MFTDYTKRENRLKKKDYSVDFRLADNDDFFGFSEIKQNTTITDIVLTVLGLVVLWVLLVVWFSF